MSRHVKKLRGGHCRPVNAWQSQLSEMEQAAVNYEREACARACDLLQIDFLNKRSSLPSDSIERPIYQAKAGAAKACADRIRARGKK